LSVWRVSANHVSSNGLLSYRLPDIDSFTAAHRHSYEVEVF
jgi:hypothetical protein